MRISAGLAVVLLAVLMSIIGPNPVFIVMAVLILAGLVVTRWKMRIGALLILLPSIALVLFGGPSIPFAVSNPIAVIDISGAMFFTLTVLAIVNVLAVLATLAERFLPSLRSSRGSMLVAALAVVSLVAIGGLGGAARLGFTNATAASGDTRLEMTDSKFSTESMDTTQTASIFLVNSDSTTHTFTIDGGVNQTLPANSRARATLNLKPGQYRYYCAVPGHAETMHGTITVH